jgi:hypothetical protein
LEILGFRFGASPQDIAREVARKISIRAKEYGRGD